MDMLAYRYEENQIGWACAAQNPALLPDSVKKIKSGQGSARLKQHAQRHFENEST